MNQKDFYINSKVRNAASKKEVRESKKAKKERLEVYKEDLRKIIGSVEGRRFLYQLIFLISGCFHTSFSNDPLVMAFKEGQKNVGLGLLNDVNALFPEAFFVMVKENQNEETIEDDDDDDEKPNEQGEDLENE